MPLSIPKLTKDVVYILNMIYATLTRAHTALLYR